MGLSGAFLVDLWGAWGLVDLWGTWGISVVALVGNQNYEGMDPKKPSSGKEAPKRNKKCRMGKIN